MKLMNIFKTRLWLVGLTLVAAVGCSKKNEKEENPTQGDKFFIAAQIASSSTGGTGTGTTYMLTADDLESGETTIVGKGIEVPNTFTHYLNNGNKAVFGLLYGQGNDYLGSGFKLDATGKLVRTGADFILAKGFVTVGAVGNNIITSRSGQTLTNGNKGATFYFIDFNNNNTLTEKSIETSNFQGTGLEANFVGIEDAGNNEFLTGVTLTSGDQNKVYVAKLDFNLNVKKFYTDDRLSYSAGQRQSARYSQMGNADNGDTYVFSGSYSATTTKPAGALVIKKGIDSFDPSYYFNIEEKAGFRFKRVYHLTEDYFLIEFYNTAGAPASSGAATQFGIVHMSTKEFKWVSGIPEKDLITSTGWPYTRNGKAYFGITTANEDPAVYVIDAKTATAKKGLVVKGGATAIAGLAYLTPQN